MRATCAEVRSVPYMRAPADRWSFDYWGDYSSTGARVNPSDNGRQTATCELTGEPEAEPAAEEPFDPHTDVIDQLIDMIMDGSGTAKGVINLKGATGKKAVGALLEDIINIDLSLSKDKQMAGEYSTYSSSLV